MMMGEEPNNLTKLSRKCDINEDFGLYKDILGLLGNVQMQQAIFFEVSPKSACVEFIELVGDALCNPKIKRWVCTNEAKKPEIAYAILNIYKQAYLLAMGQTRKRAKIAQCQEVDRGRCEPIL